MYVCMDGWFACPYSDPITKENEKKKKEFDPHTEIEKMEGGGRDGEWTNAKGERERGVARGG